MTTHICIDQQNFQLLPQKVIFWEAQNALLVADVHVGKAATFRSSGIAIPGGTTADDLQQLTALTTATGSRTLYILGDFFHAKSGITPQVIRQLEQWRAALSGIEVVLIRGNHDRHTGSFSAAQIFDGIETQVSIGGIVLQHEAQPLAGKYVIGGHVHPAVRMHAAGKMRQTLPCFFFSDTHAILPAFGTLTGSAIIHPRPGERVFVIAGDEVIEISG